MLRLGVRIGVWYLGLGIGSRLGYVCTELPYSAFQTIVLQAKGNADLHS